MTKPGPRGPGLRSNLIFLCVLCALCGDRDQAQPEVLPQLTHLQHAPLRIMIEPHVEHGGASS